MGNYNAYIILLVLKQIKLNGCNLLNKESRLHPFLCYFTPFNSLCNLLSKSLLNAIKHIRNFYTFSLRIINRIFRSALLTIEHSNHKI